MTCVLVVENDEDVRDCLGEIFEASGVSVRLAANGEEAIAQLDAPELPDMLLVDTQMPRMDGRQLLDWLQAHSAYDRVPVVIASGDGANFEHPRAAAVLPKPFGMDDLMHLVTRLSRA